MLTNMFAALFAKAEAGEGESDVRFPKSLSKKQLRGELILELWRRDRDSNPGYGLPYTHFPGVRLRPLGHLSVAGRLSETLGKEQVFVSTRGRFKVRIALARSAASLATSHNTIGGIMKRRDFLTTATVGGAGAILGLRAMPVLAQGSGALGIATAQVFKVGDVSVTALSDGFLPITPEALIGVTPEEFATLLAEAYIPGDAHPTGVNAYLIDDGTHSYLVDVGTGTAMGPGLGQLGANMAALGIEPAGINAVIATHLHPDHIGGVLTEEGNPFTQARLIVAQGDLDFWTDADIKAGAPEDFQPFFDMAVAAVDGFGEQLEVVSGEASIAPGLTAMPLPGHTPGHMGVMLESAGQSLLIWGDIVHVPPVQWAMPDVTIAFDVDQDQARATRKSVMDMAATDQIQIAGMHIGFPGMGYLEKAGEGYHFTPSPFQYG